MDSTKKIRKLLKDRRKDYIDWNTRLINVEYFHDRPLRAYAHFAKDPKADELIELETRRLAEWHLCLYIAAALSGASLPMRELALAARYRMWAIFLEEPAVERNRGETMLKDVAAKSFALQFVAGWRAEALAVGHALYKGLDTDLLDLRINDQHDAGSLYRHFWFLMHLFADASNLPPIVTALYSYPKDMSPYAQVLADWRTNDTAKVKRWVEEMAEFHLRQTGTPDPYGKQEFDHTDAQLLPYEILAFLRLREWSNLPNPTEFDHPLMNQPLAYLPKDVPLPRPDTPLLDAVIERYRIDYPELRTGA
jgi:hypothetical protein